MDEWNNYLGIKLALSCRGHIPRTHRLDIDVARLAYSQGDVIDGAFWA